MLSAPPLILEKTHRVIVDHTEKHWYVQNGYVYDVHGNVLGKAKDLKAFAPTWYFFCELDCGNTYTKREDLEKHIYDSHRDVCIHRISIPEGSPEGVFQPTDKAVREAAHALAHEVVVTERPFLAKEVTMQSVPRKNKARLSKADQAMKESVI